MFETGRTARTLTTSLWINSHEGITSPSSQRLEPMLLPVLSPVLAETIIDWD